MKVYLNGIVVETTEKSLKNLLEERGFVFPCKARGVCGKCRIVCGSLEPTERDRRFLSEEEIGSGVRLACDKAVADGIEIEATLNSQVKIEECDGYAILEDGYVEVGIVEEDLWERAVFDGEFSDKKAIESVVAHGLLDFLEKYDVAKTTSLYVVGKRARVEALTDGEADDGVIADGATFRLPTEEVVVLPLRGKSGSDELIVEKSGLDLEKAVLKAVKDVRFRVKL